MLGKKLKENLKESDVNEGNENERIAIIIKNLNFDLRVLWIYEIIHENAPLFAFLGRNRFV
jgi:hypothetical protein